MNEVITILKKIKDFLFEPKKLNFFAELWMNCLVIIFVTLMFIGLFTGLMAIGILEFIGAGVFAIIAGLLLFYGVPLILQILTNTFINTRNLIKNKKGDR